MIVYKQVNDHGTYIIATHPPAPGDKDCAQQNGEKVDN